MASLYYSAGIIASVSCFIDTGKPKPNYCTVYIEDCHSVEGRPPSYRMLRLSDTHCNYTEIA